MPCAMRVGCANKKMADQYITDLPAAVSIQDTDALLVDQNSVAKMITGMLLKNYINRNILTISVETVASTSSAAVKSYNSATGALVLQIPQGVGISTITAGTTSGLQRNYIVTYEDGSTDTITVYDGKGISSVVLTSGDHSPGTLDTYRINFTDGTHQDFYVYNGKDGIGSPGDNTPLMDAATGSAGSNASFARQDHVHPANAKKYNVTFPSGSWSADQSGNYYTKDVTSVFSTAGATITNNTKVDIQAGTAAILRMMVDGTTAVYVENSNGTLTAYAIGGMPAAALAFQAVLSEVG